MIEKEWIRQTNVAVMTMKWNKPDTADKYGSDNNEMEQLDTADKCGSDANEMEEPSQLVAEPGTSAPAVSSKDMGIN